MPGWSVHPILIWLNLSTSSPVCLPACRSVCSCLDSQRRPLIGWPLPDWPVYSCMAPCVHFNPPPPQTLSFFFFLSPRLVSRCPHPSSGSGDVQPLCASQMIAASLLWRISRRIRTNGKAGTFKIKSDLIKTVEFNGRCESMFFCFVFCF